MKFMKPAIGLMAALFVLGIAGMSFAQCGYGYGGGYGGGMMGRGMMGYGPGYGRGPMGYYGSNNYGDLSREDSARLDQTQTKFFDETRELRTAIRDKQFALDDELQKANPDKAKVNDLQKQLSQLEDQFDQKALDNRLAMRKEFPNSGYARGYGRGYCMW